MTYSQIIYSTTTSRFYLILHLSAFMRHCTGGSVYTGTTDPTPVLETFRDNRSNPSPGNVLLDRARSCKIVQLPPGDTRCSRSSMQIFPEIPRSSEDLRQSATTCPWAWEYLVEIFPEIFTDQVEPGCNPFRDPRDLKNLLT